MAFSERDGDLATYYSDERGVQLLIQLMKAYGIRKVVVSPGSTNVCFVASIQQDSFFELYSSVDERSAAYFACGLSAQCGEAVALSCTGATASRNYMPGLTEAFYRHLPILAITSTQPRERVGRDIPQVLDRQSLPNDIVKTSVYIPPIHDEEHEWASILRINEALISLTHLGGGPAHIDLATEYNNSFTCKMLPEVQKIDLISQRRSRPILSGKIAVFVGSHAAWSEELTAQVDAFCSQYDSVVLCDRTSNYWGKYRVLPNALCGQLQYHPRCRIIDTLIVIGEISGAYLSVLPKEVWRVHPDGALKDPFKKLTKVFEMDELDFFQWYCDEGEYAHASFYQEWQQECSKITDNIPELPYSNVWAAQSLAPLIPADSVMHFGILNSLRSWNYFETSRGVNGYSNVGGFGIDGGISSLIGASTASPDQLFFGVFGDLAFFYDINALGNRHIGGNVRVMLVNNGRGTEFRNAINWASMFGDETDPYIAAAGHFGNQSRSLVKHFAEDLGFVYYSASNKREFKLVSDAFVSAEMHYPIIFELFTRPEDESEALELLLRVADSPSASAKELFKNLIGDSGVSLVKRIIGR